MTTMARTIVEQPSGSKRGEAEHHRQSRLHVQDL
jgi:hypothetical protein